MEMSESVLPQHQVIVDLLLGFGFTRKVPIRTDKTWDGHTYTYTPNNSWDSIDIDVRELHSLSSIIDKVYFVGRGHGYTEATYDG
mgnify:CR=1 FL=1